MLECVNKKCLIMKRIKIVVLVLLLGGSFAYNNSFTKEDEKKTYLDLMSLFSLTEAQAEISNPGVPCYCGATIGFGKGCKADNAGKRCNPDGVSECWKYDRNCSR